MALSCAMFLTCACRWKNLGLTGRSTTCFNTEAHCSGWPFSSFGIGMVQTYTAAARPVVLANERPSKAMDRRLDPGSLSSYCRRLCLLLLLPPRVFWPVCERVCRHLHVSDLHPGSWIQPLVASNGLTLG